MVPYRNGRPENAVNVIWRLLLRLTGVGLVIYGCYRMRNIITTLFIAAIICYVLEPMVDWLMRQTLFVRIHRAIARISARVAVGYQRVFYRRKVDLIERAHIRRHTLRVYASLYVFVLFVLAIWYAGKLIINPFADEFKHAAQNRDRIAAQINRRLEAYDRTTPEWAHSNKIREMVRHADFAKSGQSLATEAGKKVLESAKSLVEVVVLPVLAFYFLIDGRQLKHEFFSLVPRRKLSETIRMANEFNRIMRAFVIGQVILCVLAGILVGVVLAWMHVPYPFVMGVLAGLTRAIPIIGPIIGGIPIILLTLATQGMGPALGVLGFFTFLHFAESKFLMPLVIGDRLELHPVVIIIALLVGGEIGGLLIGGSIGSLLGMFFAAPVGAILRVMVRRYWLGLHHPSRRHLEKANQVVNGAFAEPLEHACVSETIE